MIPLFATAAWGGDVLPEELARWAVLAASDLAIDRAHPYRAILAADDVETWRADAEFGSLITDSGGHIRPTRVEVVLGDDTVSSSRFRGGRATASPSLPIDDLALAIDRDLWLSTDASFKGALKTLELKRQAYAQLGSPYPPDRAPALPIVSQPEVAVVAPDAALLRGIAVDGSARFAAFPALRSGRVEAFAITGRAILAASDGTRVVTPQGYAAVYAWCEVARDDGVAPWAWRQWVAPTAAELPPLDEIAAEIDTLARSVLARAALPVVDYYEGPVVFEGQAAAALLRSLVVPEISGTPPEPQAGRTYAQLTRGGPRLGRQLFPDGWAVSDDPDHSAFAPDYDRQGVPTGEVALVEDGRVARLLMNDVPRADLSGSTGNARGNATDAWNARPWNVVVTPAKEVSEKAFDKAVAHAAADADLPRVLVVRRLTRQAGDGSVPAVADAVWRAADGAEEPVLALEFQSADRRILRDIVAASGTFTDTWLQGAAATTSGLPTGSTTPARILISQLEAVFPGTSSEPALYAPPEK
jgi:hypothetical protein